MTSSSACFFCGLFILWAVLGRDSFFLGKIPKPIDSMTIYIGNIPFDCTEAQLFDLLTPFGTVFDLNYPTDRVTGAQRGFAFVTLPDRETAEEAIQALDGALLGGRNLRASEAKAPERPASKGLPVGFRKQGENPFGGPARRRR